MIDLTSEVTLLETTSLPDTLSEEESDGVEIIREYHPVAPTIDVLLSTPYRGHQIRISQDLPKVRYASSGVKDLISRHLQSVQSGEAIVPLPRPLAKSRKGNLEIVNWFLIDDPNQLQLGPQPSIPILVRDDQHNPVRSLVMELWFQCKDTQVTRPADIPKPQLKRGNSVTVPPVKRPKLQSFAAQTVDQFLENLLKEKQKPATMQQRSVTLTLDVPSTPHVKPRELTAVQKAELEREVRRYNRNNLNEFYSKLGEIDLFAEEQEDKLKEIPLEFENGKQYIDVFKAAFYSEMKSVVRAASGSLEARICIDLRVQKDKDGFMHLVASGELLLPAFRSNDILLCAFNDENSPWKPTKPMKRPPAHYFLGIVERVKENSYSTPIIRANSTATLRGLFATNRENQFWLALVDGCVTLMREFRAIQSAEFTDLFPLLINPREELPDQPLKIADSFFTALPSSYNHSQVAAIAEVCRRGTGVSLIQGPPGTGKTHTILGLISAFLSSRERWENKPSVLVCAPSNNAVDEIALRAVTEGLVNQYGDRRRDVMCVRVGVKRSDESAASKQPGEVTAMTIGQLVAGRMNSDSRNDRSAAINSINAEIAKVGKSLSDARSVGQESRVINYIKQQKILHERLARERHEKVIESEKRKSLEIEILNNCDVIFTTLAGTRCKEMEKLSNPIDFLIIDEACQSAEPTVLIPLQKQTRLMVLVGDPMQLPATVVSQRATQAGYGRSLFERLMTAGAKVTMLTEQYRMAPYIRAFPSQQFYSERLTDARSIITRKKPEWLPQVPFAFFDLKRSEEVKDVRSASFGNPAEAEFISLMVSTLYRHFDDLNIAVISPYRRQVQLLRDRLHSVPGVEVDTVDGFQGREKDAVIISTVRSQESLGFLTDNRRLNVAITRAKFALWVVGCARTLQHETKWSEFLRHCDENGNLRVCGEFNEVASLFRSRK